MLQANSLLASKAYSFAATQSNIESSITNSLPLTAHAAPNLVLASAPRETAPDTTEHHNIKLAKEISHHRQAVKLALSGIPLSALWVLMQSGQNHTEDVELLAEEALNPSQSLMNNLADCYQQLELQAERYGVESSAYHQAQHNLSNTLRHYPYSAEQLKKVLILVGYAYTQYVAASSEGAKALWHTLKKITLVNSVQLNHTLAQLGLDTRSPNSRSWCAQLLPDLAALETLQTLLHHAQAWLKAREKLAHSNSRLVLFIANQYKSGFLDFNDLVQEGQSGLLKAVDRFDYQRGVKFSTYAVYWIKQGISRALSRNERVVRLPFGQMANINKLYRVKDAFFLKTGNELTSQALAEQTGLSDNEVNNLLCIAQTATSLDTPVSDDENSASLADFLEQQVFEPLLNPIAQQELTQVIQSALHSLSPKEAAVLACRFGFNGTQDMTLEEIGQQLHLTRERVRQIQVNALKKLKQQFGHELVHFL